MGHAPQDTADRVVSVIGLRKIRGNVCRFAHVALVVGHDDTSMKNSQVSTISQQPSRQNTTPGTPAMHEPLPVGALRVLVISTIAFTLFFAVWVMFAIVGLPLRTQLGLTDSQFALLAAIPILSGSVLRIPMGMLTDVVGGRRMMAGLALFTAIPAFWISTADGYTELVVLAFFLGMAGTSFSVGIPWVSAWFPASRQGAALGVFGAGNVGASITKLLAPSLVTLVAAGGLAGGLVPGGWRFVPFAYGIIMVLTAIMVLLLTPRVDPMPGRGRSFRSLAAPLAFLRVWRFGYYYMIVFGAYVALTLWLPKYYVDVYGTSLGTAGLLTSLFIFPASLLRPVGGWMSDRIGARRVTAIAFTTILAASIVLSFETGITLFTIGVVAIGVAMGFGKASVYRYVPQYYPRDVGAVGGLVGAVGGIGGFVLPLLFARANVASDSPQSTFVVLAVLTAASLVMLAVTVFNMVHDNQQSGDM
jgi:NNP family nitrate/nitrite transporter-like MFS transporter